ncbi:MAG: hypothetical protein EHM85_02965 [Desulfobacteraceae bacterium]|nr:MAG: hypothetical protein EHM85_02965 [Desulfobacteraceae bacterium]
MKKSLLLVTAILLTFVLMSCDRSTPPKKEEPKVVKKISVRIPWIRTAATTGLEVAAEQGFFKEVGLEVEIKPGSVEASPLRKVLNSEDQFGILEPAQVLVGIAEQKMPLVILAMKMQRSPFCLMSKTEKGIKTIQDMKGKRIGYNPLNDVSYLAMLKAGNVKRENVKEVRVQFNLEPFLQEQVDVWPSYISNEPVVAKEKGVNVSLICADDVGVHLYEHALFARKDFVQKSPEVVEAFIRAWIKGWQFAIKNPEQAVDIVMKRTEGLDRKNEQKVLEIITPLITGGQAAEKGIAWVDPQMIDGIGRILVDLKLLANAPAGTDVVDNSFLQKIDRAIPAKP